MSFRRFLHLVATPCGSGGCYSLRQIDASRLFFWPAWDQQPQPQPQPQLKPLDITGVAPGAVDLLELPSHLLPDPAITFASPSWKGFINFTLLGNSSWDGGERDRVVTMDHAGRCTLVRDAGDTPMPATVLQLPNLAKPKLSPASLTVGGGHFVIEELPCSSRSFEALFLDHGDGLNATDWCWETLPSPPFAYEPRSRSHVITSYAVAGGGSSILISNRSARTYSFDTAACAWSKDAGDWALPFCHLAEYVPEHRLWFGISSADNGYRFCAANLAGATGELMPPVIHGLWQEYVTLPKGWNLIRARAVHMGSSRFCIFRLFEVLSSHFCPRFHEPYESTEGHVALLTGVEVRSCGQALYVGSGTSLKGMLLAADTVTVCCNKEILSCHDDRTMPPGTGS